MESDIQDASLHTRKKNVVFGLDSEEKKNRKD